MSPESGRTTDLSVYSFVCNSTPQSSLTNDEYFASDVITISVFFVRNDQFCVLS